MTVAVRSVSNEGRRFSKSGGSLAMSAGELASTSEQVAEVLANMRSGTALARLLALAKACNFSFLFGFPDIAMTRDAL